MSGSTGRGPVGPCGRTPGWTCYKRNRAVGHDLPYPISHTHSLLWAYLTWAWWSRPGSHPNFKFPNKNLRELRKSDLGPVCGGRAPGRTAGTWHAETSLGSKPNLYASPSAWKTWWQKTLRNCQSVNLCCTTKKMQLLCTTKRDIHCRRTSNGTQSCLFLSQGKDRSIAITWTNSKWICNLALCNARRYLYSTAIAVKKCCTCHSPRLPWSGGSCWPVFSLHNLGILGFST